MNEQPELEEDLGPYIQIDWAKIRTPKDKFIIGLCYNSPKSSFEQIELMNKNIACTSRAYKHIITCRDFNFVGINWSTLQSSKKSEGFLQTTMECFLTQHGLNFTRQNSLHDIVLFRNLKQ